jgi:phage terminase large subunit-like protein
MDRVIVQNPARALRVINFLEKLPIIDGPTVGLPMLLDPWQKAWVTDIYSPAYADTGRRVVRSAGLTVARKNSKSFLTAGLLLCHLFGPESETNGQVYSCANDRDQASLMFRFCKQMIELRPAMKNYLGVTDSQKTIYVHRSDHRAKGSFYKALSSEAFTKHGFGPSMFAYDELGESASDELLNTMIDGQQLRTEPLYIFCTTQNNDPEHHSSQLIDYGLRKEDPAAVVHCYAADEGCAIDDRDQWIKANPALLSWKPFEPIEAACRKAKRLPSLEHNFRRRYLNQRVSLHAGLIAAADWAECGPIVADPLTYKQTDSRQFEPGEELFAGFDASVTTDLSALVLTSLDGHVKSEFWKPRVLIPEHNESDARRYDLYADAGWLHAVDGRAIDPAFVAKRISEIHKVNTIRCLALDPAYINELIRCLEREGLIAGDDPSDATHIKIVKWYQGTSGMAPGINAFETAVLNNELRHDGNPLLTFCVLNAQTSADSEGKRKFDKRATRFRIDGAVALAMALGLRAKEKNEPKPYNPYTDPEFSMLNFLNMPSKPSR